MGRGFEIQAYLEMLKALTVFTVKSKRQGEGVRLVVSYSPESLRDVRTHYMWPLSVRNQDLCIEEGDAASYYTTETNRNVS